MLQLHQLLRAVRLLQPEQCLSRSLQTLWRTLLGVGQDLRQGPRGIPGQQVRRVLQEPADSGLEVGGEVQAGVEQRVRHTQVGECAQQAGRHRGLLHVGRPDLTEVLHGELAFLGDAVILAPPAEDLPTLGDGGTRGPVTGLHPVEQLRQAGLLGTQDRVLLQCQLDVRVQREHEALAVLVHELRRQQVAVRDGQPGECLTRVVVRVEHRVVRHAEPGVEELAFHADTERDVDPVLDALHHGVRLRALVQGERAVVLGQVEQHRQVLPVELRNLGAVRWQAVAVGVVLHLLQAAQRLEHGDVAQRAVIAQRGTEHLPDPVVHDPGVGRGNPVVAGHRLPQLQVLVLLRVLPLGHVQRLAEPAGHLVRGLTVALLADRLRHVRRELVSVHAGEHLPQARVVVQAHEGILVLEALGANQVLGRHGTRTHRLLRGGRHVVRVLLGLRTLRGHPVQHRVVAAGVGFRELEVTGVLGAARALVDERPVRQQRVAFGALLVLELAVQLLVDV